MNYVWVNERPVKGEADSPLCGVPLSHLDMAYKNAASYPQAQFNIWIDFARLDDMSRFFVHSHGYLAKRENVTIRDLNDIPRYQTLNETPDHALPIWMQVDLARLLVLSHQLDESGARNIFYADFDVDDVALDCPHAARKLHLYGMCFGRTFSSKRLENGYIAFQRGRGSEFLNEEMIPQTMLAAGYGYNGYDALRSSLHSHWQYKLKWMEGGRDWDLSVPRLHEMGYEIIPKPIYTRLDINRVRGNKPLGF